MRISADERYAGFAAYWALMPRALGLRVLLDGVEAKHVIVADEELGEVLIYVHDERGAPVVEDDRFKTRRCRGRVEIVIPAEATA